MSPAFVLDASCVASAVLPDENSDYAAAAMRAAALGGAVVPDLFWHELGNLLLMAERRLRLPEGRAEIEWEAVFGLPIETRLGPSGGATLAVARRFKLTAYDACYAVQAIEVGAPLATLDRRLSAAGEAGAFKLWRPA